MGPSTRPRSSSHVVPVISPDALRVNQPAKTGVGGVLAAGMDGGDPGAHGAGADLQGAVALDQRDVADLDARDVGDGVEGPRGALEGDAEVSGAGGLGGCDGTSDEKMGEHGQGCDHGATS